MVAIPTIQERVLGVKSWCMSLCLKMKYKAGTSNTRSLKKDILGTSLMKSPKHPQSVTRIFVSVYGPQAEKSKKLASPGTYPVRNVNPVSIVKKRTNTKNIQL